MAVRKNDTNWEKDRLLQLRKIILEAAQGIEYGSVSIVVQDNQVIQVNKNNKIQLT